MSLTARITPCLVRCSAIVLAALGCIAASANSARADFMLGVDLDSVLPLQSRAEFGGGFAIRLGDQLHVPAVAFTPELAFSYDKFSKAYGPSVYRGVVGARLSIGELIRPGVYAHVGFGKYDLDIPGADPSGTAITYDAGLSLDFTLLPLLNLGVHGSYNVLLGDDEDRERFKWLTLGAHVELVF